MSNCYTWSCLEPRLKFMTLRNLNGLKHHLDRFLGFTAIKPEKNNALKVIKQNIRLELIA